MTPILAALGGALLVAGPLLVVAGLRRVPEAAPRPARTRRPRPWSGAARIVTFANGMVVREPIVALDEARRRLVWTAEGGRTTHYNSSAQVFDDPGGARIVWTSDFLPDDMRDAIDAAMTAGAAAMKKALSGP